MESITDEEFDILLQAVNRNDGMFHYTETTTTYPEGCPCPCRRIGDNIVYEDRDPFDDKFGKVKELIHYDCNNIFNCWANLFWNMQLFLYYIGYF